MNHIFFHMAIVFIDFNLMAKLVKYPTCPLGWNVRIWRLVFPVRRGSGYLYETIMDLLLQLISGIKYHPWYVGWVNWLESGDPLPKSAGMG